MGNKVGSIRLIPPSDPPCPPPDRSCCLNADGRKNRIDTLPDDSQLTGWVTSLKRPAPTISSSCYFSDGSALDLLVRWTRSASDGRTRLPVRACSTSDSRRGRSDPPQRIVVVVHTFALPFPTMRIPSGSSPVLGPILPSLDGSPCPRKCGEGRCFCSIPSSPAAATTDPEKGKTKVSAAHFIL